MVATFGALFGGRLMARSEKREGEQIRAAIIVVDNRC